MATVRTSPAPPASDKRKRKRLHNTKSMAASSSSVSSVDAQLETLENWHRALTIDIRELRREGARVRIELEKVDDVAEAAVEKAEQCAALAQAASKVKDEAVKETQKKLHTAETRHNTELEKLKKRLGLMDKKLERYRQSSINEEFLMTQLTELQEQYENELTKVREDHDAALDAQQKQLEKMERVMVKIQEEQKKQAETMEMMWREENSRLTQKLKQVATRQEMYTLQQQVETMERDNHDEQGRTRVDLNNFEDKLVEVERRVAHMDIKVQDVDRKVDDVGTRDVVAAPTHHQPLSPPPPPALPRDLVRQGELVGIHDELRRINRDFQAVGVDISALAKRTDARASQQEHHFETRIQDLSTQVFDALGHDSRQHATEISRLKDALFDVQSDSREFGQRMRRLEGDVQQAARAQPSQRGREGGTGWRYGQNQNQNQPAVLPTPPQPSSTTYRNRRERPSRYEPAPDFRENTAPALETPPQDRIRWEPRRRSRSPPRHSSWGATGHDSSRSDSGSATAQNGRQYQRDDQQYIPTSNNGGDLALTRNTVTELSGPLPSLPTDSAQNARGGNRGDITEGNNREEQTSLPFRRSRQPRRTPEVIVIEEDDDDDDDDDDNDDGEDNNAEESEGGEQEGTALSRAPPDAVLDEEEASQPADVIMVDPPGTANAGNVETTDLLEHEADLQTGFLLYFCLGGAPDFDVQWTNCFTQLHADECVEMPRVLRFQRRYGFLQSFPVYLTQCILQAVIVNGQNAPEGNDAVASQPTGSLNTSSMRAKFDDMVKGIHLSWAKALVEHLSKQARGMDELAAMKLELSVNPAGLSSSADKDDIIYEWSRRQESVMWILARKFHYGSFLPVMRCNVDASPAVYLFTIMFDVMVVTSECPQFGSFRLNTFGAKVLAYLWNHTLKKLPYVFFADWSWLEDQSTKGHLPALAFCHLLVSILLWNSAIDRHSLTNRNVYAAAVTHVFPKLYVDGKAVHESVDSNSLLLCECESTRIELLDLDSKFASMLGLDGFFEVTEAIQNNMLAVAAAAAKDRAAST